MERARDLAGDGAELEAVAAVREGRGAVAVLCAAGDVHRVAGLRIHRDPTLLHHHVISNFNSNFDSENIHGSIQDTTFNNSNSIEQGPSQGSDEFGNSSFCGGEPGLYKGQRSQAPVGAEASERPAGDDAREGSHA